MKNKEDFAGNKFLDKLWHEDQDSRRQAQEMLAGTDHAQLCLDIFKADAKRATAVKQFLLAGEINTAEDYYKAAMILLHNEVMFEELALGIVLAHKAIALGHEKGDWLLKLLTQRFEKAIN